MVEVAQSDRELLKKQYSKSSGWARRVDAMTDGQVSAIILRLKKNGKLK